MKISHLYEDFTIVCIGDTFKVKPNITRNMINLIFVPEIDFRTNFPANNNLVVASYANGQSLYGPGNLSILNRAKAIGIYECLWVRFEPHFAMYPIIYFDRVATI